MDLNIRSDRYGDPPYRSWLPDLVSMAVSQANKLAGPSDILTHPTSFPYLTLLTLTFYTGQAPKGFSKIELPALTSLNCLISTEERSSCLRKGCIFLDAIPVPALTSFTLITVGAYRDKETHNEDHELGRHIVNCIQRSKDGSNLKTLKISISTHHLAASYKRQGLAAQSS